MGYRLAFALGGGGARGALQIGALRALLEAGLQPDLLVGTSIGAANAAFLALNGFTQQGLDQLVATWREAASADLLPANYFWLTVRAMFGRSIQDPSRRVADFFISHGLSPDLCFDELQHPRLVIVSSDLNTGQPVLHGDEPGEKVLEALLLSTALPPWTFPVRKQGRYLMDGGVVSNLPVEPAIKMGAERIIALDLLDAAVANTEVPGWGGFLEQLVYAVEKRQADLELELAKARGIPIVYMGLAGDPHVALWDFQHAETLIAQGYDLARQMLAEQRQGHPWLNCS